nr:hypothetical protein CFP56_31840 [Quercus suber]
MLVTVDVLKACTQPLPWRRIRQSTHGALACSERRNGRACKHSMVVSIGATIVILLRSSWIDVSVSTAGTVLPLRDMPIIRPNIGCHVSCALSPCSSSSTKCPATDHIFVALPELSHVPSALLGRNLDHSPLNFATTSVHCSIAAISNEDHGAINGGDEPQEHIDQVHPYGMLHSYLPSLPRGRVGRDVQVTKDAK